MNIVLDTSVIIAVIANEPEKKRLIELTRGQNLIAPVSVHLEIGNAFSAMFKKNQATLSQSIEALKIYQKIPIRLIDVDLIDAVELSDKYDIYAYDAYIISCALKNNSALVSLDQKLIRIAKKAGAKIEEVKE